MGSSETAKRRSGTAQSTPKFSPISVIIEMISPNPHPREVAVSDPGKDVSLPISGPPHFLPCSSVGTSISSVSVTLGKGALFPSVPPTFLNTGELCISCPLREFPRSPA